MTPKEIFDILEREVGKIPDEENKAQKWFRDAYIKGSDLVQKALLELITYDVIRIKDNNEEILWVFRNVLHEKHEHRKKLRQMFYEGHGEEALRQDIIKFLQKDADKDNLDSIIFMGHIHTAGFSVEKNIEIANKWYKKAAIKGDGGAQLAVGDYHFHKEEYKEAHDWYERAGKRNKKTAYIRLSRMYKLGLGVDVDPHKAQLYKNKVTKVKIKATKEGYSTTSKVPKAKIRTYKPKSKKHEKR